ncbi:MAG: hypothetical protein ACRDZ3_03560 [Acidimicrobiia bacterium]
MDSPGGWMVRGTARRLLQGIGAVVLLSGLLTGDGMAAEDPLEGFYVAPSLQISPELPDVRPSVPIELTARLSHTAFSDIPVHFQLQSLSTRVRPGRPRVPAKEQPGCTIPAGELTCAITLVRHDSEALIVRGWLGGEPSFPPDTEEGRLSSLNLFVHPGADCRVEDGEPFDDKCRGGLNSQVQPGNPEPDTTDVILAGWTGTGAAFVDCDDTGTDGDTELEVRPLDQRTVSYLCTLTNRATGKPIVGGHIAGEVMGGPFDQEFKGEYHSDYGTYPYHPEEKRLCTTTAPGGHCRFDLTVPTEGPGEMVLCLWANGDNDGYYSADDEDGGGCANEKYDELPEANDGADTVLIRLQ